MQSVSLNFVLMQTYSYFQFSSWLSKVCRCSVNAYQKAGNDDGGREAHLEDMISET
jgi:hypothetical protein